MARTQTVTILFCDLVASTERRARLGDDAFDEFTARFMGALRDAIAQHHGREVSSAGDGLMVVFPDSVADAVACAMVMHRSVAQLDADDPPRIRIGISSGEVARDGDEFSGMPIVEAARLEALAAPGQTLANAIVRALVGTRRALRFRDVGALTLKGIPEPLATVEVIDEDVVDAPRPSPAAPPKPHAGGPVRRRPGPRVIAIIAVAVILAAGGLVAILSGSNGSSKPGAHSQAGPPVGVTAPKGYTPRFEPGPCPADVRKAAANATCGDLVVPQNRSNPLGKQVRLLVTEAPPRLPGPVGVPTIDVCGCEDPGNSLARDHSELIHVAQRGYDGSDPELTCPQFVAVRLQALTVKSDDPTMIARTTDALRTCHADLVGQGIDPGQYNFDAAAHDVLDLMFALKIKQANFIAYELAAAEVFDIVRNAPGALRSITLDNPPPPGNTGLSDPVGDLSGAFGRFVGLCEANPTCKRSYPDLRAKWRSSYEAANADPPLVAGTNPWGSTPATLSVRLDGPRTADALAIALETNDPSTYKLIPAAITGSGADPVIASLALQTDRLVPEAPWGAQASYFCSYDVHTADPQGVAFSARTLPEFLPADNTQWVQWCKGWNVPDISAVLSADVVSDVPTLLFRANLSPLGNPTWISTIERGLSNVQAVVFPTLGGDLLADGPPCLSALRRQFLAHPGAKLRTAACAAQSPPIPFVAP